MATISGKEASDEVIEDLVHFAESQEATKVMAVVVTAPLALLAAVEIGGAAGAKFVGEELVSAATGLPVSPSDALEILTTGTRAAIKAFSGEYLKPLNNMAMWKGRIFNYYNYREAVAGKDCRDAVSCQ